MSSPAAAAAVPKEEDAPLLLCPACGFDLRATVGDRCGECGLDIDRAGLRVSGIPWAHRGTMGRIPAYAKTVRAFALDRGILFEAVKPQEIRDGRAFARVTGFLLAAALAGMLVAGLYAAGGLVAIAIRPGDVATQTQAPIRRAVLDGAVPWCAGATIPGVLPVCVAGFAFWLASAQRFAFRTRLASADRARAAVALSYYTTAPLLMLIPAMACWVGLAWLVHRTADTYGPKFPPQAFMVYPRAALALSLAGGVIAGAAVVHTLLRVGQWLARTRQCSTLRALPGVGEVVGLWLLGAVVLLGLAPWCVGLVWIAVDGLR